MIALLRGRLFEKHPTRVIVETGGVGYEVHMPLSSFASIGDVGSDVTLRVHTHVREDALQLFGFTTALEQTLFERLVSVSGIGPRLALAVLSGIAPQDLVRAVSAGDAARLVAIPGIGRKTADRIVLELRDKMASIEQAGEGAASGDGLRADLRVGARESGLPSAGSGEGRGNRAQRVGRRVRRGAQTGARLPDARQTMIPRPSSFVPRPWS